MTSLRVSATQMTVTNDVARNTALLRDAIRQAHAARADILLTPEGALSGYTHEFDPQEVSAALAEVTAAARQNHLGLALGTCFQEPDGKTYDELRFYAPDGAFLGFHSKLLLCGTLAEPPVGEINHYATTPLRTFSFGRVPIGGLVCNDLWANPQCTPMPDPHLTQGLARLGARVIFHAVNGGRDGGEWSRGVCWNFHESNLRMRAAAAAVWIVTVDSSEPVSLPCAAPGGVITPQGEWAWRVEPQGEQFYAYTIDL